MSESSSSSLSCPQCGATLPSESTEGLCPRCLLSQAMHTQPVAPPTSTVRPASTLTPEELAPFFPQYEIQRILGRGGMGAVYLARQISLNRLVAIKILPAGLDDGFNNFAERFKNEAQAMAQLSHPGILAVYDFGETTNGLLYIAMEYIDGTDVQQMVVNQGRLHSAHAMAITAHVCDALAYAHGKGIIHRDIKPSNIMINQDGVVKVADFGLAKMSQAHGQSAGLTQSGVVMGTLHFMAPEALTLGTAVDQRADIYAVGVMLYQMLTGKLPQGLFEMPSLQVSGLDPRYDGIVAKALREDRALRYQYAVELRHDLDAILTQPVVKVEPEHPQAPAALPAAPPADQMPQRSTSQVIRPPQRSRPVPVKKKSSTAMLIAGATIIVITALYFLIGRSGSLKPRMTTEMIEGEDLKILRVSGGKAEAMPTTGRNGFWSAVWSNNKQLEWSGAAKNDTLTLRLPVQESGAQRLRAMFTRDPLSGVVEVKLDGKEVQGSPLDLGAHYRTTSGLLDLGVFDLTAGDHELTFEFVSTKSKGWGEQSAKQPDSYAAALDFVRLEPPDAFHNTSNAASAGTNLALTARPSASVCCGWAGDHVSRLNDGKFPASLKSGDNSVQRFGTFPDGSGGLEWVQYEWDTPQFVEECQVLWRSQGLQTTAKDPVNQLPHTWRIVYADEDGAWLPVDATMPPASADRWNAVRFHPVKTRAIRLVIQSAARWTVGIYEWRMLAADPSKAAQSPSATPPSEIFLGDLPPQHDRVGWDRYRASQIHEADVIAGRKPLLAGKECTRFLKAHAPSQIDFRIPHGYTRFRATGIGLKGPGTQAAAGTWQYQVRVDGRVIFDSKELSTYPNQECPIDVALPVHGRVLSLITEPGTVSVGDDSYWAEPILVLDSELAAKPHTSRKQDEAPLSATPDLATKNRPFANSLGMKFVPVPITGGPTGGKTVLFSIWETRVQDYEAFVTETRRPWPQPNYSQSPSHPAVIVSWQNAADFAEWLTLRERSAGKIGAKDAYRLPTDHEWSCAVEMGDQEDASALPVAKSRKLAGFYPWGRTWPPPDNTGNFKSAELRVLLDSGKYSHIKNPPDYRDGHGTPAPVGSYAANNLGLHDLAGNVWEWCQDWEDTSSKKRVLRGGDWEVFSTMLLQSTFRFADTPAALGEFYGFRLILEVADANTDVEGTAKTPTEATKDRPFINSLGMKFVPVPGTKVLFCIHETRRQDYAAYADEVPDVGRAWKTQNKDGIPIGDQNDHPVVGVHWEESQKFCSWLAHKESLSYRLPTDEEWSVAIGLAPFEKRPKGVTLEMLNQKERTHFPWGGDFPPKTQDHAGNYADTKWKEIFPYQAFIEGYTDGFATTAPVMSFKANAFGLYDMGGNVWEWVDDWWNPAQKERGFRGASFDNLILSGMLSSDRHHAPPLLRDLNRGFRIVLEMADATKSAEATAPVSQSPSR